MQLHRCNPNKSCIRNCRHLLLLADHNCRQTNPCILEQPFLQVLETLPYYPYTAALHNPQRLESPHLDRSYRQKLEKEWCIPQQDMSHRHPSPTGCNPDQARCTLQSPFRRKHHHRRCRCNNSRHNLGKSFQGSHTVPLHSL